MVVKLILESIAIGLNYVKHFENNHFYPIVLDKEVAHKVITELVKCGYTTSQCNTQMCSCRKSAMLCAGMSKRLTVTQTDVELHKIRNLYLFQFQ